MTDQEKFQKLVETAVERGYWFQDIPKNATYDIEIYDRIGVIQFNWEAGEYLLGTRQMTYEQIIFNHDFMKALFKSNDYIERICLHCGKNMMELCPKGKSHNPSDTLPAYQYHLIQTVLKPTQSERIDYLYESINSM
jgi:hypothetical protein